MKGFNVMIKMECVRTNYYKYTFEYEEIDPSDMYCKRRTKAQYECRGTERGTITQCASYSFSEVGIDTLFIFGDNGGFTCDAVFEINEECAYNNLFRYAHLLALFMKEHGEGSDNKCIKLVTPLGVLNISSFEEIDSMMKYFKDKEVR